MSAAIAHDAIKAKWLHADGVPAVNALAALTMPQAAPRGVAQGEVRVGPVRAIPAILREFGVNPASILVAAAMPAELFADDTHGLTFRQLGTVLEQCVLATGCPHFGLLVGERFDPEAFGDTARLMLTSASVGAALQTFALHHHLIDAGAVATPLPTTGGRTGISYSVYAREVPALDVVLDTAIAIGVQLMRCLCGRSWHPLRVSLAHRPPADLAPYHALFGRNVRFNAELSAYWFAASWLDRPVLDRDPARLSRLQSAAPQTAEVPALSLAHLVQRALRPMVLMGTATETEVARLFALHPRALRRRLRAEGCTFQNLVNDTRLGITRQLLQETDLPLTEIARALHYSDLSSLTRAFRTQTGLPPSAWRHSQTATRDAAGIASGAETKRRRPSVDRRS